METTNIYTLTDPRTNEVRYVGKANNVKQRYKAHLNRVRKHQTHKKNWLEELRREGLKPIIGVIDVVPIDDWQYWETYWISQMKQWGFNLVNHTNGGDGCTFTNRTSFKKGEMGVKIVSLTKNGNCVNIYNSTIEAENKIGKSGIDSVLSKKTKTCGGFIWLYHKDYILLLKEEVNIIVLNANTRKRNNKTTFKNGNIPWNKNNCGYKLKSKKVLQLDLDGEFINEYDSVVGAAKLLNCKPKTIRSACNGINKTGKGFKWKYK